MPRSVHYCCLCLHISFLFKGSKSREKEDEAEGRHEEADRGGPLVCSHQLTNESCRRGETLVHLNGDPLKKGDDDTLREKLPQTDPEADGDKPKQTKNPNSAKLRKDGRQKTHGRNTQPDANSREHMQHLESRGTPTVPLGKQNGDNALKPNHEPQKKIRKTNNAVRETQTNAAAETGTKPTSLPVGSHRKNRVKPAGTRVEGKEMEAAGARVGAEGRITHKRKGGVTKSRDHSDVKTFPVGSDEPTKLNYSPDRYRKSHSSERVEERRQRPPASPSKRRHDMRDPWR